MTKINSSKALGYWLRESLVTVLLLWMVTKRHIDDIEQ